MGLFRVLIANGGDMLRLFLFGFLLSLATAAPTRGETPPPQSKPTDASSNQVVPQSAVSSANDMTAGDNLAGQSTLRASDLQSDTPWSASYLHWITDMASGDTYNYLKVNYKVNNSVVFSVVPVFYFDYKWNDGNISNTRMGDSYFQLAKSGVWQVEGTTGLDVSARVYLPTASATRDKGTQGRLYGFAGIGKELTKKWSTSLASLNWYYQQSRESYVDSKGAVKANVQYVGFHAADLSYAMTDKLTFAAAIQLENNVFLYGPKADVFYIDTSATYDFGPRISLNLGLSNSRALTGLAELGGSPQTNTAYLIAKGKLY